MRKSLGAIGLAAALALGAVPMVAQAAGAAAGIGTVNNPVLTKITPPPGANMNVLAGTFGGAGGVAAAVGALIVVAAASGSSSSSSTSGTH